MPVFTYKGVNRAGATVAGERSAETKAEVTALLRREQINVSKLSEKGKEFNIPTFGTGVDQKELAIFTRQFSVMIDAGLPLVQCLEILGGQQENKTFQKILNGVRGSVEGGSTLSNAMKQHEKVFDPLYSNMVEAGETGGILDTILQRLSTYIEKNVKLKRAVRSAMIYPVSVIGIAAMVITLLLWKVVPIFVTLFNGLDVDLPLPTRIVIGLSNFVGSIYGLMLLVFFIATGVALKFWYGTPQGRMAIDRALLQVPVVGMVLRKIAVARFTRTLGTLDFQRRSDSRRAGHHGAHFGQRRGRKGHLPDAQGRRSGPLAGRSAEGNRRFPGHGDADDRRRRADRRDGRHAFEDRRLLRGRSGRGREGHADGHRADHDRFPGRGGRRRGHFHVFAAVLADRQARRTLVRRVVLGIRRRRHGAGTVRSRAAVARLARIAVSERDARQRIEIIGTIGNELQYQRQRMAALAGPRPLSRHHVPSGRCRGHSSAHSDSSADRANAAADCRVVRPGAQLTCGFTSGIRKARWHAAVQTVLDLCVITAMVYATGVQDSYFVSLYLRQHPDGQHFVFAARRVPGGRRQFHPVGMRGGVDVLRRHPSHVAGDAGPRELESWLASNLFAFFAVAYLGSLLAQTSHKRGVELEEKSEALKDFRHSTGTSSSPCAAAC